MRRLICTTAVAALLAGGAAAQTGGLPEMPETGGPVGWTDIGLSARSLMGGEAVARGGDALGEVHDVLMTEEGRVVGMVLSVGGALGIGERLVAFRAEDVEVVAPDRVEINVTPREVERRIAFDYDSVTRRMFAPAGFGTIEPTEQSAAREDYLDRWSGKMERWSGRVARRADRADDAAAETLREAWSGVEREWAEVRRATADGWGAARDGFESAFDDVRSAFEDAADG